MMTKEELASGLAVLRAIADTIRELGSVPSGHLYAQLCGKMTLETYQSIIRTLCNTGLVKESGHLLTWNG